VEIIVGVLSTTVPKGQYYRNTGQKQPNILGESDLAQNPDDVTPTPDEQPPDQPQDTPTEIIQPTSEEPNLQEISPTPQVGESQTTNGDITIDTQINQNPPSEELKTNLQFLDTMVFTDFTPDNFAQTLDPKTLAEVNNENQQLAAAQSPQDKADLLVQFESKGIQTINSNFKTNQFDDLAFNTARLNSQIDKTIETIQNLPPDQAQAIRSKISNICKSAEYLLRPGELVVSEDLEQAIQISRGKCFNFQQ